MVGNSIVFIIQTSQGLALWRSHVCV